MYSEVPKDISDVLHNKSPICLEPAFIKPDYTGHPKTIYLGWRTELLERNTSHTSNITTPSHFKKHLKSHLYIYNDIIAVFIVINNVSHSKRMKTNRKGAISCIYMYVICIFIYVFMYICTCILCMYVCMYVMYVCMYVCIL